MFLDCHNFVSQTKWWRWNVSAAEFPVKNKQSLVGFSPTDNDVSMLRFSSCRKHQFTCNFHPNARHIIIFAILPLYFLRCRQVRISCFCALLFQIWKCEHVRHLYEFNATKSVAATGVLFRMTQSWKTWIFFSLPIMTAFYYRFLMFLVTIIFLKKWWSIFGTKLSCNRPELQLSK